jgi:hypothetical protein
MGRERALRACLGLLRSHAVQGPVRSNLDELYDQLSLADDLMGALGELMAVLWQEVAAIPGIVGGLRVDPDGGHIGTPEQLRDAAARFADLAASKLAPVQMAARCAHENLAALYLDQATTDVSQRKSSDRPRSKDVHGDSTDA